MRDQLERLVAEMVDKGVHFDDALREFEKRFIARALQRTDGSLGEAAELLGIHRNTLSPQDGRIPHRTHSGLSCSGPPAAISSPQPPTA